MSTIIDEPRVAVEPAALRAWAEGRTIFVELHDERIVGFPADRFRILAAATDEQLARVKIEVNGYALALGGVGRGHYGARDRSGPSRGGAHIGAQPSHQSRRR